MLRLFQRLVVIEQRDKSRYINRAALYLSNSRTSTASFGKVSGALQDDGILR